MGCKSALKGAWSGHMAWPIYIFCGPIHISEMAEARVVHRQAYGVLFPAILHLVGQKPMKSCRFDPILGALYCPTFADHGHIWHVSEPMVWSSRPYFSLINIYHRPSGTKQQI